MSGFRRRTMTGDIRSLLLANAELVALGVTSVTPLPLPQGVELPALTVMLITGRNITSHSGSSGLRYSRYQIDAWADDSLESERVGNAVVRAMFSLPSEEVEGPRAVFEDPDTGVYRHIIEVLVHDYPNRRE